MAKTYSGTPRCAVANARLDAQVIDATHNNVAQVDDLIAAVRAATIAECVAVVEGMPSDQTDSVQWIDVLAVLRALEKLPETVSRDLPANAAHDAEEKP